MAKKMRATSLAAALAVGIVALGAVPATATGADEMSEAASTFQAQAPVEVATAIATEATVTTSDNATAQVDDSTAQITTPEGTISLGAAADTESVESEPILMEDGSALIAIVINEPTHETAFRMDIGMPDGAIGNLQEDGSIAILSADGDFVGGIAAPWARDVNGTSIPTEFELDGNTLVQHVDLSEVPIDAYPVVADPWAGHDLVASAWITNQGGTKYVVNAVPTSWGEFYRGVSTLESHLVDLKADLGYNKSKVTSTIINQFYCHVAYGWLGGGATYNMESWRPDILWSVQGNPITQCNP